MFEKRILKWVACVVVVSYVSVFNAECVLAADLRLFQNPVLLAQAETDDDGEGFVPSTQAEREAQQAVYFSKIQRIEADINRKRGTRNTLMTVAIASGLIGAGVAVGASSVYDDVDQITIDEDNEDSVDTALKALEMAQSVGWGIVGLGGVSLVGYLLYSAAIGGQQKKVDALYDKMQAQLGTRGGDADYLPEHLQKNEMAVQLWDDIASARKSSGSARSWGSFFSRVAVGTILSGGFLFGMSSLTNEVVDQIDVDSTSDETTREAKEQALDTADSLQTMGLIMLGVGLTSGITSYLFGKRVKTKEREIDELEDQILLIADRINIHPNPNGFMVLYSYNFK